MAGWQGTVLSRSGTMALVLQSDSQSGKSSLCACCGGTNAGTLVDEPDRSLQSGRQAAAIVRKCKRGNFDSKEVINKSYLKNM
jgi:hypothetical protein